ncbi:hypothetical protein COLSTE_00369 [Collinsella stercoris DSM 13279]|uniref:Uncharacterized protein n=1 Tax=Collinsella stercoris DSM 13279 TaxID=445975 RepID=B6G8H7_9ACTN|nr:hypothetical protein COLSTE_00369 [Collinsella stercoris DSM 13279]
MHATPCLVQREHWLPFHISPNSAWPRKRRGHGAYLGKNCNGFRPYMGCQ